MSLHYLFFTLFLFLSGCLPWTMAPLTAPVDHSPMDQKVSDLIEKEGLFTRSDFEDRAWWKLFGDEQLSCYIERGICQSPSLASIASKVVASEQMARAVKSQLLPLVTTDGNDKYWHVSQDGLFRGTSPAFPAMINLVSLELNFSYNFDFWGRYRAEYFSALGEAASECAMNYGAQLDLSIAIAKSYFDLKTALAVEKELYSLQSLITEQNLLTENRYQEWVVDQRDPLNTSITISQIEARIASNKANIEIAKAVLKSLLGVDQDHNLSNINDQFSLTIAPLPIPESLSLGLLGMRPDLAAQIWKVKAAAWKVKVAKTAFYPNISLSASGGLESIFWGKVFSPDSLTGFLLPAFTFPLYTGGRLTADLKRAVALYQSEAEKYHQMVLDAASNVIQSIASLKAVHTELVKSFDELSLQKEITLLTDARYLHGVDNRLSAIMASMAYHEKRILWLNMVDLDLYARLVLIQSLGGGYQMGASR